MWRYWQHAGTHRLTDCYGQRMGMEISFESMDKDARFQQPVRNRTYLHLTNEDGLVRIVHQPGKMQKHRAQPRHYTVIAAMVAKRLPMVAEEVVQPWPDQIPYAVSRYLSPMPDVFKGADLQVYAIRQFINLIAEPVAVEIAEGNHPLDHIRDVVRAKEAIDPGHYERARQRADVAIRQLINEIPDLAQMLGQLHLRR